MEFIFAGLLCARNSVHIISRISSCRTVGVACWFGAGGHTHSDLALEILDFLFSIYRGVPQFGPSQSATDDKLNELKVQNYNVNPQVLAVANSCRERDFRHFRA